MITVSLQIGNSDDKLSQPEWSEFVHSIGEAVKKWSFDIHFFGCPPNWMPWQNVAWIFVSNADGVKELKKAVKEIREEYKQNSAAWLEGETVFV